MKLPPISGGPITAEGAAVAGSSVFGRIFGVLGGVIIAGDILREIGDEILARESRRMIEEAEAKIKATREQIRRRRQIGDIQTIPPTPEPVAPQPEIRLPQRIELPTEIPPVQIPFPSQRPIEIEFPTLPGPATAPKPTTFPGTGDPFPGPGNPFPSQIPAEPGPTKFPQFPTELPEFPVDFPTGIPTRFGDPFPDFFPDPFVDFVEPLLETLPKIPQKIGEILDPRVRNFPEISLDRLTAAEPQSVPSPRPATCPPCPKRKEEEEDEEETPRDECWKQFTKQARFARDDETVDWIRIDCDTGKELTKEQREQLGID